MKTYPIGIILPLLEGVKKTGKTSWMARCPAHEDTRPSLSIRLYDDESISVKCFAGCPTGQILGAVGLQVADMFPDSKKPADYPHHRPAQRPVPWRDFISRFREDLTAVQIGAARMAAGDDLSESDLDRLGQAAVRIQEALNG